MSEITMGSIDKFLVSWGSRMDAYYFSFERTGIEDVDRILSLVATAGKMYHHTSQWCDTIDDAEKYGLPAWVALTDLFTEACVHAKQAALNEGDA